MSGFSIGAYYIQVNTASKGRNCSNSVCQAYYIQFESGNIAKVVKGTQTFFLRKILKHKSFFNLK